MNCLDFLYKIKNYSINQIIGEEILKNQNSEYEDLKLLNEILNTKILVKNYSPICNNSLSKLVKNEVELEKLTNLIRNKYMINVYKNTCANYKSPLIKTHVQTMNGSQIHFAYERLIKYREFEDSISVEKFRDFLSFNIVYSSGMAAITGVIDFIEKSFSKKEAEGFISAAYFETIQLIKTRTTKINICFDDIMAKAYYDFYFLEPVKADFELEKSSVEKIIKKISQSKENQIIYLVIDSSMQGKCFSINKLFANVDVPRNFVICNIRSGIKLDEEGMEISNCGLVTFYFSRELEKLMSITRNFMEKNREIYGRALSFNDVCLLDNKIFFKNENYSKYILNNTKQFVDNINKEENKLFKRIVYPDTTEYNFLSPYLFLKFENDDSGKIDDYELLLDIIYQETLSIGMEYNIRNSFGFRNISSEFYKIINDNIFVFKIAPGKLAGVRYHHYLYLVNEISKLNLDEYRKLREFYKSNHWSVYYENTEE